MLSCPFPPSFITLINVTWLEVILQMFKSLIANVLGMASNKEHVFYSFEHTTINLILTNPDTHSILSPTVDKHET